MQSSVLLRPFVSFRPRFFSWRGSFLWFLRCGFFPCLLPFFKFNFFLLLHFSGVFLKKLLGCFCFLREEFFSLSGNSPSLLLFFQQAFLFKHLQAYPDYFPRSLPLLLRPHSPVFPSAVIGPQLSRPGQSVLVCPVEHASYPQVEPIRVFRASFPVRTCFCIFCKCRFFHFCFEFACKLFNEHACRNIVNTQFFTFLFRSGLQFLRAPFQGKAAVFNPATRAGKPLI